MSKKDEWIPKQNESFLGFQSKILPRAAGKATSFVHTNGRKTEIRSRSMRATRAGLTFDMSPGWCEPWPAAHTRGGLLQARRRRERGGGKQERRE
jgi:hypothetical protein